MLCYRAPEQLHNLVYDPESCLSFEIILMGPNILFGDE